MEPEPEPAGEPFAVVDGRAIQQHNAEEWARVRARFNIPDNILDGFRFATLHPSGGKGGDLLKFHGSYYIIKQVTGSDQETLLKFTHDLAEHVCTGDSLIARFFLHFCAPRAPARPPGFSLRDSARCARCAGGWYGLRRQELLRDEQLAAAV